MSFDPASNIQSKLDNMQAFFNIAGMCLKRNNPVVNIFMKVQYFIHVMCTVNQKLKIVKQRVNHMQFRLHQMEQLIQQNTSGHTAAKGTTLNQIR